MAESPNDKKFMREKIVKPPIDKRQLLRKFLRLLVCAVIFGIVAAVTFVVSKPVAEKIFPGRTEEPTIPIPIERDTEPGDQGSMMETMEETTEEAIGQEELREEIEKIVDDSMENFTWSTENVSGFYKASQDITQKADKSIVTVSSVRHQVDWFDNPVESAGQYAGMIVTINPREAIILTREEAVADADALNIIFGDGSTASGTLRQRDTVAKLATVSVATSDISEATMNWIGAIKLGNSYMVRTGEPVIAVGSPVGRVHSVGQGIISYAAKGVQVPDSQTRVFYTNMNCDVQRGTFILNLAGQLVGWATDQFESEETPDVTMILSLSEYKGVLQKLSNGEAVPYLGIMGQDVTEAMSSQGIPKGVYITETVPDSPVYRAGIQSGDILTMIQGEEITSMRDLQSCVEKQTAGNGIRLTVKRKGIDEYKEIQYDILVGAR